MTMQRAYTAQSGTKIYVRPSNSERSNSLFSNVFDIVDAQNLSFTVIREMAPIYTMGNTPLSIPRGKWSVSGTLTFSNDSPRLSQFDIIVEGLTAEGLLMEMVIPKCDVINESRIDTPGSWAVEKTFVASNILPWRKV